MQYELVKKLGQGGMGLVYLAKDKRTSEEVAFKILLSDENLSMDGVEAARRLKDEARATAAIDHDNLLRLLDSGESEELGPFIVYEYVKGGTLRQELGKCARLDSSKAVKELALPLLSALEALHEAGIVHRDIKSDNVFIKDEGNYVLGDLGLAFFDGREAKTITGHIVGTPGYIAPELIRGEAPIPASDIYSMGILLVEALTGKRPFASSTPQQELIEQLKREPSSDELIELGVPSNLAPLLAKALKNSPEERIADTRTFSSLLHNALGFRKDPATTMATKAPEAASLAVVNEKKSWTYILPFMASFAALLIFSYLLSGHEEKRVLPRSTYHKELVALESKLLHDGQVPERAQLIEMGELISAMGVTNRLIKGKETDKACLGLYYLAYRAGRQVKSKALSRGVAKKLYTVLLREYGLWRIEPVDGPLKSQINDIHHELDDIPELVDEVQTLVLKEDTKWKRVSLGLWQTELMLDYVLRQKRGVEIKEKYREKAFVQSLANVEEYIESKGRGLEAIDVQKLARCLTLSLFRWRSMKRKGIVASAFDNLIAVAPENERELLCHLVGEVLLRPCDGRNDPPQAKEAVMAIPFYEKSVTLATNALMLNKNRLALADTLMKSNLFKKAEKKLEEIELEVLDDESLSRYYMRKARLHLYFAQYKEAFKYCDEAIQLNERMGEVPSSMTDLRQEIRLSATISHQEYK